jgi:hypothetical protein
MSGSPTSKPTLPPPVDAYRLQGSAAHLLNHLCFLGEGRLILRQDGLSLAKLTPFGLCVADGRSGWHLLRDAISGLETDLQHTRFIYILPDPDDGVPVFATAGANGAIDLSVRLEEHDWHSRTIRAVLEHGQAIRIDAREGRRLGAGAWLDDWKTNTPASEGSPRWDILAALDGCRCLEVELHSALHRCAAAFRPAFLDSDGPILRIADTTRRHVVFVDSSTPGFRWQSLTPGHLGIRIASPREMRLPAA